MRVWVDASTLIALESNGEVLVLRDLLRQIAIPPPIADEGFTGRESQPLREAQGSVIEGVPSRATFARRPGSHRPRALLRSWPPRSSTQRRGERIGSRERIIHSDEENRSGGDRTVRAWCGNPICGGPTPVRRLRGVRGPLGVRSEGTWRRSPQDRESGRVMAAIP